MRLECGLWLLCALAACGERGGSALRDASGSGDGASVVPHPVDAEAGTAPADAGRRPAGVSTCSVPAPTPFTLPRVATGAVPSGSPEDAAAGAAPELSLGPIVGAVSAHDAKVWFRSNLPASSAVSYWADDDPDQVRTIAGPALDATTDYVGVVRLPDLRPGTGYGYRVSLAAAGTRATAGAASESEHRFTTLPAADVPGRVRVAVGADIAGRFNQPIFQQIAEAEPDVLLLIGDQVYADEVDASVEGYAGKYRFSWDIRQLRPLLSGVPSAMIWDDHEIIDDYFAGKSWRYEPARTAYELYVHGHNPDPLRPEALYYTFEAGEVGFFVLDVRSYRSAQWLEDGPGKTMLGPMQKADLLTWLSCSPARIKVIVSPVIFSAWTSTRMDSWAGYLHERDEILDFISANRIDDVLLITGDQHWSAVFLTTRDDYRFYEFLPTPLSKDRGSAPLYDTPEIVARDDDHFVFGIVDIDTRPALPTIALTLCARDLACRPGEEPPPTSGLDLEGYAENVPFTLRLTSADLGIE